MDIRHFLRKIRDEQSELELLLLKRDNIIVLHGIAYDRDKIVSSNDKDISDIALKNVRLLNLIDKKIKRFKINQHKAIEIIYGLSDSQQRQIMILYYLSRKGTENDHITLPYTLEEVADTMHLSFNYVRHVHGDALQELRKNKSDKTKKGKCKKDKKEKALG